MSDILLLASRAISRLPDKAVIAPIFVTFAPYKFKYVMLWSYIKVINWNRDEFDVLTSKLGCLVKFRISSPVRSFPPLSSEDFLLDIFHFQWRKILSIFHRYRFSNISCVRSQNSVTSANGRQKNSFTASVWNPCRIATNTVQTFQLESIPAPVIIDNRGKTGRDRRPTQLKPAGCQGLL